MEDSELFLSSQAKQNWQNWLRLVNGKGKIFQKVKPERYRKKIVIICEGSTEEIYFGSIRKHKRLSTVKIKVVNPDCSDPLNC